ncbi:FtsX-like permease family protein [Subsaximicrobium wynnwilliamsii]|uniref:FtsX-like permease family protein n=1 Tax=Subsaximicrobium wynnwilliamsii TaxID=291179 RepID=A0A5C6ZI09_9FLAO|nr:ABC transporter permease [Subsaximicrobium wynnwilliamsii]TXD83183.1 FtsX-like permease family protein [Subsaximicrobium wynnwilliamsii]TXD88296.1 FtsX-like permease family protein [Subsaximicrobium wynnwilliamsii]TXE03017.1 FtsX-like permease family protein [Subsaximicrobium wynnwilliamsii]
MIRNYFKIAWRNILANKLFTLLNIAGLAIGVCVCVILFSFVNKELSYDKMYSNSEDIYRVNMETSEAYDYETWATMPNAVGPAIVAEIPQVETMTRLIKDDFGATASLKIGDKNYTEDGLYLADASLFKMFDFKFLQGNSETAFSEPKSIVLSMSAKEKLFGAKEAMHKLITVNNSDTLQVSGIYADLPKNSVMDCAMVYNIMDSWMGTNVYWSNASYETYVQLQPNADVAEIEKRATALIDKNVDKDGQYFTKFIFQPLTKIHLYSADVREGYSTKLGNITTIKSLMFLSLLVLFIACINYMNLATANSRKRAKGIGVNKVLGANRRQMLFLFYVETGILVLVSIIVGYAASFLTLPLFQNVTSSELAFSDLLAAPILVGLLLIWIVVTIIAGSYPAIAMSGISPLILVNKSKKKNSASEYVRKGLVVFQFAASIVLIIAVTIILQQMAFIKNKNLGYDPNGIIAISVKSAENQQQIDAFTKAVEKHSNVESVSAVQAMPGVGESGRSVQKLVTDNVGLPIASCRTNGKVVKTLKLNLLAGNELPEHIAEGDSIIYTLINEKILSYLDYKTAEDAVGKIINTELGSRAIITGVVKNFNFSSLKEDVGGYMYYKSSSAPEGIRTLLVRYNTQKLPQFMGQLEKTFNENLPNTAFDYQFVDRHVAQLYASEEKTASTATIFSALAIFIACLGLFGLAAFMAEQRTKEIGVRKVLGATVANLTKLLTKDFLKLVLVAFVIAAPIAYWLMNKWLLDFAYRTEMSWWVFALAGLAAVLIALITVSFQAIKAAIANPVKSLRTE